MEVFTLIKKKKVWKTSNGYYQIWKANNLRIGSLKFKHRIWRKSEAFRYYRTLIVMLCVILLCYHTYYSIYLYIRKPEINSSRFFKRIALGITLRLFWLLKCFVFLFPAFWDFFFCIHRIYECNEWIKKQWMDKQ